LNKSQRSIQKSAEQNAWGVQMAFKQHCTSVFVKENPICGKTTNEKSPFKNRRNVNEQTLLSSCVWTLTVMLDCLSNSLLLKLNEEQQIRTVNS